MDETEHKAHPVAALFPLMTGADFTQMVADMVANGYRAEQPIWLHSDGSVLDGRNRLAAAAAARVAPVFKTWPGQDAGIVQFVASMNLRRRHMSEELRAFIAADLANLTRGGDRGNQHTGGKFAKSEDALPLVSRGEAASVMQVQPAALDRARAVGKHAPELKEKVLGGDMSLTAAAKEAARRAPVNDAKKEAKRTEAVERGKDALKKKREAERARIVAEATRKLRAWMVAYGEVREIKATVAHVRLALASLEG